MNIFHKVYRFIIGPIAISGAIWASILSAAFAICSIDIIIESYCDGGLHKVCSYRTARLVAYFAILTLLSARITIACYRKWRRWQMEKPGAKWPKQNR